MGFNNTVEIITKDIEELEKIIRNFQNYSRIPRIELDLALGKMQNIYEMILMIRETEEEIPPPPKTRLSPEHEDIHPVEQKSREEMDPVPGNSGNEEDTVEFLEEEEEEREQEQEQEETAQKEVEAEKKTAGDEEESENKELSQKEKILAEKFRKEGDVNEKIGGGSKGKDLSSKIQSTPIKSIAGSMGINDKFIFIRELFNGNAENFRTAMSVLDQATNFNEAYNYLLNTFNWDMNSEIVQQLLNLIRRKFISPGNE